MFDDRSTIQTPEGIELDLTLAGLGSRIAAALLDGLILGVVLLAGTFALAFLAAFGAFDGDAGILVGGLVSLFVAALFAIYFIGFEVQNDGQTPGKRIIGISVVSESGQPVSLSASVIRNVIRIVDLLPSFYLVGIVSVLASERNQRLGDIAANTLVVRTKREKDPDLPVPHLHPSSIRWDTSGVSMDDIGVIRRFLARRAELQPDRAELLASRLAATYRPKVPGVEHAADDLWFLEQLVARKMTNAGGRA